MMKQYKISVLHILLSGIAQNMEYHDIKQCYLYGHMCSMSRKLNRARGNLSFYIQAATLFRSTKHSHACTQLTTWALEQLHHPCI